MRLESGVTVEVAYPVPTMTPEVVYPPNISVMAVGVLMPGPRGPQGDQGADGPRGNIQHTGTGPPGLILGAQPGDTYLDQDSGLIYTLS